MYMEITANRFLGNSAVVTKYENWLKTVCDNNKVTRAEVEAFYRQNIGKLIAAVALEQFNRIDFWLERHRQNYVATLSINPETREYILNHTEGFRQIEEKQISGRNLNALLTVMRNSPDYDARSIEQVETMANLIPAVVYAGWLRDGTVKGVDAVSLAAKTIADYYLNPTQENYNLLAGVFGLFRRRVEDKVAEAGERAYRATISELSKPLGDKAADEGFAKGTALARAVLERNPDYAIFATPYRK
jgi:hypothetical protein